MRARQRLLRGAWLAVMLLPLAACTRSGDSLLAFVAEALSLPVKVYLDSSRYPGPETVVLASADGGEARIVLTCTIARPLTGSFWGGHADYQAAFDYEFQSHGAFSRGHYWPREETASRDADEARARCESHRARVAPRDGGFDIFVGPSHAGFVSQEGLSGPGSPP